MTAKDMTGTGIGKTAELGSRNWWGGWRGPPPLKQKWCLPGPSKTGPGCGPAGSEAEWLLASRRVDAWWKTSGLNRHSGKEAQGDSLSSATRTWTLGEAAGSSKSHMGPVVRICVGDGRLEVSSPLSKLKKIILCWFCNCQFGLSKN